MVLSGTGPENSQLEACNSRHNELPTSYRPCMPFSAERLREPGFSQDIADASFLPHDSGATADGSLSGISNGCNIDVLPDSLATVGAIIEPHIVRRTVGEPLAAKVLLHLDREQAPGYVLKCTDTKLMPNAMNSCITRAPLPINLTASDECIMKAGHDPIKQKKGTTAVLLVPTSIAD